MVSNIPLGIDDFRALRERGLEYVDKSDLIRELLDLSGAQVVLLPRPRRFGKTLNLTMLRAWFEKSPEDLSPLFQDLAIWGAGDSYRAHFQRYPVIYFNFKGTRQATFASCLVALKEKIIDLFSHHRIVLDSGGLDEVESRRFHEVLAGTALDPVYERALFDLSTYLHRHHGEKVVILIDEYDEPIHAGHAGGFLPEILAFMRAFLGAGLKSNEHLFRAVVTGILRVAKENLFSGLNNLAVYSLLRSEFNGAFGFTEDEVVKLLAARGWSDKMDDVRAWYNGYLFGGRVIYNPWSLTSYLGSADAAYRPYWLSTSSNDLIKELLEHHALNLEPVFESLLEGGTVEHAVEDNIPLNQLADNETALFSLLVFAGYLKAEALPDEGVGPQRFRLAIPNREVREVYATTFSQWLSTTVKGQGNNLKGLIRALLSGDAETVEEHLQTFVVNLLSYHDVGGVSPEQVYQGFVVGLLAAMEPDYLVRSNREAGHGRPDVTIRPRKPGKPGVVLELKVAKRKKTLEEALAEGLRQVGENDYTAELRAAGVDPVHVLVVAFDGKVVRVENGSASASASP